MATEKKSGIVSFVADEGNMIYITVEDAGVKISGRGFRKTLLGATLELNGEFGQLVKTSKPNAEGTKLVDRVNRSFVGEIRLLADSKDYSSL